MNQGLSLLGGIGLGAGLMYFLDPHAGRQRRERLRDRILGALRSVSEGVDTTMRTVAHHKHGLEAEIRSWAAEGASEYVQESGQAAHEDASGRLQSMLTLNVFEENWTPATRMLAGTIGCALMANCLAQRTLPAALLGTVGFGLFVRSLSNVRLDRLLGVAGEHREGSSPEERGQESSSQNFTDGRRQSDF
jgi:hypothetical protein